MARDPRAAALNACRRAGRAERALEAHRLKLRRSGDRALYDAERAGWSLRSLARELQTSHTAVAKRINRHKNSL